MWNLLQDELGGGLGPRLLVALVDTGAKGLILMAAAGLTAAAMRRNAAAARHLVWMLALCGLLLLPVASLMMPKWTLPILPALEAPAPAAIATSLPPTPAPQPTPSNLMPPSTDALATTPPNAPPMPASQPAPATQSPATPPMAAPSPVNLPAWALTLWLTGALLAIAPFIAGIIAVARLRRRADTFADSDLQALAACLAQTLAMKRPARLLRAPTGAMPMATGFLRPAVFLPEDALAWTEEKRRVVLLHELAHVKRRDCLTHAIARTATSLHWFNPLAWLALRQLRIEREHACDDLVLAAGERPSAYAENLLEIARTLRADTITAAAAITMAQKSQLEGRLLAVLDAARNRSVPTPRVVAGLFFIAGMTCAVIAACQFTPAAATGPLERETLAAGVTAQSQERDFVATYANGLQARILGVGEPDGYTVFRVWAPDGVSLPGVPEGFKSKMGGSSSDKSGVIRRFFIEVFPVPEESDLGIKFKVEGNSVSHIIDRSQGRRCVNVQIYNIPDNPGGTSLELGIAIGPWESVHGTMGPHSSANGSTFDVAYSDFFEKDGKAHVVVTHTPREDDYRLVVYDKNDTPYPTGKGSSSSVGTMMQTEFAVEGEVSASDLLYMDLQARPYEWKSISGIALHPAKNQHNPTSGNATEVSPKKEPETVSNSATESGGVHKSSEDVIHAKAPSPDLDGRYSVICQRSQVEARSEDGRVILIKTGDTLLRVEAPSIRTESQADDHIRLICNETPTDRPTVGVLMGSDGLNIDSLDKIHNIATQFPSIDTTYIVQRGWDKALVAIPTPIMIPDSMKRTEEWRTWERAKNTRTIDFVDELGRKYVAHAWGWSKSGTKSFPIIPRLERYREDGTLEAWTGFFNDLPEFTYFYASDGVTPVSSVLLRWPGSEGEPHVRYYTWRDSEGKYHQYDMTPNGIIQYEWLGTMADGQAFDTESILHQINDAGITPFSFSDAEVVKPVSVAGRENTAATPEKLRPTEDSIPPTAQKERSANAAVFDKAEAESLAKTIRTANPGIAEKLEEQASVEQTSSDPNESPYSIFNSDFLGTMLEAPNLLTHIVGDAITPPAADTSWGPVVNSLQAAVRFKPEKPEYLLGEKIDMEFLVRNTGPEPLEFLTSETRNSDELILLDENKETGKGGGIRMYTGIGNIRRVKLAPGEVAAIDCVGFAVMQEGTRQEPEHPIGSYGRSHPGLHEIQFNVHFPDTQASSGESAPRPGDWKGTLTTGKRTIQLAAPGASGQAPASAPDSQNPE